MKNLSQIMKQAQQLQSKMEALQAELETLEVEGASGGGLVRVVMTGKHVMRSLSIDQSLMKEGEGEILEDLIITAVNDAKAKADAAAATRMKSVTGGLPLPPGFGI